MKALQLYIRYALRSFIRGRSRSFFGAFCVAVGIASVVSLGLVGGNFRDAVTGNAQKLNRGDVSIQFPGQGASVKDYRFFANLKARGAIADYTPLQQADAMLKVPGGDPTNIMIGSAIAVERQKFPYYDTITADQPSGTPLAQLLAHPNDTVVPHAVFDTLHLHIGSTISTVFRFGGARTFTVTGVVPDNAQDPGFGSGIFPYFVMTDRSNLAAYDRANNLAANTVYIRTRDAAQAAAAKAALLNHFGPLVNPKTIVDVERDSKNSADNMDKFFRMMGLVAVVIGGIGIINTMLVAARRRLKEIAVLKAIGMKGRQVVLVFTIESFFLAITGTAAGLVLGILTSAIVNNITQSLAGYPIPWSLHAQPIVAGILVGIVATILFAYLPVLRASRARPVAALRDSMDMSIAKGFWRKLKPSWQGVRTFLLVLFLAGLLGYLGVLYTGLVGGVKTLLFGVIAGVGTLVGATVLTMVFVGLIWLVSKSPSFGRLSARMAFRSMGTQKRRLGSTLLALSVGILAVGTIAILAQNIKHEFAQGLEKRQNFNIGVQVPHNPVLLARADRAVSALGANVKHRYSGAIANQATLASVDGTPINFLIQQALTARNKDGSHKHDKMGVQQSIQDIRGVLGRDLSKQTDNYLMAKGRNLGPGDVGTNHIVIPQSVADNFGAKIGSRVVYADGTHRVPFVVVGIAEQNNFLVFAQNLVDLTYMQRTGLTGAAPDHNVVIFLDIPHTSRYNDQVAKLRQAVPGGFVLDLDSFLQFTKIIDKLALFPEIIAALALFAGAIIIANTVALAMLERRREIGVMKAVGARRRTILQFLLIENAIVGFLGAGVGVLLAMFATYMVNKNLFKFPTTYDWTTIGGLVLLGMLLAVGASSLTALPASSEKPMSVLRYE
ncbi:MAG: ABC transporter permease [Chloroflexota bacterium]